MLKSNRPPKVAAIQDLSSVGRCSLTATIPTLSAMGYQVIPLPTAILSTQTWGYDRPYFIDLSDELDNIIASFDEAGLAFSAVYSGYLASVGEVDSVERFLDIFSLRPDERERLPLILVDPVLGEDGMLYSTVTRELAAGMVRLVKRADVITPNLTEACLLLGEDYRDTSRLSLDVIKPYMEALLLKLQSLGPRRVVITGVEDGEGGLSNYLVDEMRQFTVVRATRVGTSYPGTGDLFASILLGNLLGGAPFVAAVRSAAAFISGVAAQTEAAGTPVREGVLLERALPELFKERQDR